MGVLTTLLFDECIVQRELPAGEGRCDIMIAPKDGYNFGAVIELKYVSNRLSTDRLKKAAESALNQIIKKEYSSSPLFNKTTSIYAYGLAFYKKHVQVVSKKIK